MLIVTTVIEQNCVCLVSLIWPTLSHHSKRKHLESGLCLTHFHYVMLTTVSGESCEKLFDNLLKMVPIFNLMEH